MRASDDMEEFAVAPSGKSTRVFLAFFTLVIPLMIVVAMAAFPDHRPPPAVFAISVLAVVSVAVVLLVASRRRSIRMDGSHLQIKATFYSRSVALTFIEVDASRVVDLREHPEARPLLKTNGFAVPGLMAGNFRDRKRNKLFCLVTAPRIVILALSDGSRLLVSPEHPERFLEAVRERVGRAPRR